MPDAFPRRAWKVTRRGATPYAAHVQYSLRAGQEVGGPGLEGVGDLPDGAERRRLDRALQFAEVRAVDPAGQRRRFLAEAAFLAEVL